MANKEIEDVIGQVRSTPGWSAERGGDGHYQIKGPNGEHASSSATPTDPRAKANLLADLKRIGWSPELAKDARRARGTAALQDAMADNVHILFSAGQDAKQRGDAEVARVNATRRGIERLLGTPDTNALAGYPRATRYVSPAEAEAALSIGQQHGCNKLPLERGLVEKYVSDMRGGLWVLSPEPIVFDEHGCPLDGQHRLRAVADLEPGTLIPFELVFDYPSENFRYLNIGRQRKAGHAMRMGGYQKYRSALAASVRLISAFDSGAGWQSWNKHRVSNPRLLALLEEDYHDLPDLAQDVAAWAMKLRIPGSGAVAAAYLAQRAFPDGQHERFRQNIMTGEGLGAGSPEAAYNRYLRNKPENKSGAQPGILAMAIYLKVWNAFCNDETLQLPSFRKNEKVPEPYRPGVDTRTASQRYSAKQRAKRAAA
jgi:hypothetical protein